MVFNASLGAPKPVTGKTHKGLLRKETSDGGFTVARKTREDQITLAGIRIYPRIGTTPEERADPQECRADLTAWGDFEGAAALDSLDASIDYCQVLATVQQAANSQEYHLLETLAYAIVRKVLQSFPVSSARIKLRKRPASLDGEIDFVEVEVEES